MMANVMTDSGSYWWVINHWRNAIWECMLTLSHYMADER